MNKRYNKNKGSHNIDEVIYNDDFPSKQPQISC